MKIKLITSGFVAACCFAPGALAAEHEKTTGTSGETEQQQTEQTEPTEPTEQTGQTPQTGEQPEQAQTQDISEMTAEEISQQSIMSKEGENVGSVSKLVRRTQDDQLGAVVKSGGFLGMGGEEIFIPLEELSMEEGNLTWTIEPLPKGEVDQQHQYSEENFAELQETAKSQKLSELKQSPQETFPTKGEVEQQEQPQKEQQEMQKQEESEQQQMEETQPQGEQQ